MTDMLLVITNMPDAATAETLARQIIEQRAAACVNLLAPCTSVYRWKDKVETVTEIPLLIKTSRMAYARLEALIQSEHPYEIPEIVAMPVIEALPGYLNWVNSETQIIKE